MKAAPLTQDTESTHEAPSETEDPSYARTLARGLDLLLCFRPGEKALNHRELARRLDLPGPIVVRLTYTLTALGYLRRDPITAAYSLGAAVLTLGYPLLANLQVRQVARPAMQAFSERIGGSVSLGFRHKAHMVYVETAWRGDGRSVPPDTGTPMPMLSTAMGRAWLCGVSPDVRQSALNQIRVQTPAEHARFLPTVEQAVRQFEARGYCESRGDYRKDVYSFGVPFSRPVDSTLFVMNCGVLVQHHSFAEATRLAAMPLRELVRGIEIELGMHQDE